MREDRIFRIIHKYKPKSRRKVRRPRKALEIMKPEQVKDPSELEKKKKRMTCKQFYLIVQRNSSVRPTGLLNLQRRIFFLSSITVRGTGLRIRMLLHSVPGIHSTSLSTELAEGYFCNGIGDACNMVQLSWFTGRALQLCCIQCQNWFLVSFCKSAICSPKWIVNVCPLTNEFHWTEYSNQISFKHVSRLCAYLCKWMKE